ncbi:hypothetical protein IJG78_00705 [Candidatus Saccharibacteria bacterium]|nr:hypothetical protein [Candidatus Saccharibacteria bacterium]
MYTATNKGFSIITSFGCGRNCKYCISKLHPILSACISQEDNIDWDRLEKCISETKAPEVNLSGGGDPFFEWERHRNFYLRIYEVARHYKKNLAVHSRIIPSDVELLKLFSKFAITVEYYDRNALLHLKDNMPHLQGVEINVRVVQVVNEMMTREDCENYVKFLKIECGVPRVTFREMFGSEPAQANFARLRNIDLGDGVLFLPDGDYHDYYFLHDNTLYPCFFGRNEESRQAHCI